MTLILAIVLLAATSSSGPEYQPSVAGGFAQAQSGAPHVPGGNQSALGEVRESAVGWHRYPDPVPGGVPPATVAATRAVIPPSLTIRGQATWFCGAGSPCTSGYSPSDLIAAIDPTTGIERGERVTVWHDERSVTVTIVDICVCGGERIIDLTYGAFSRLADPSLGVIPVTLVPARGAQDAVPKMTLPPTDTEGSQP